MIIVTCVAVLDEDGNRIAVGAFFVYVIVVAVGQRILQAIRGYPAEDKRDAPRWFWDVEFGAILVIFGSLAITALVPSWSSAWTRRRLPAVGCVVLCGSAAAEALFASMAKLKGEKPQRDHLQTWAGIAVMLLFCVGFSWLIVFHLVLED